MSKKPTIKHSEAEVKRAVIAYLEAKKYIFIPILNAGVWNPKGFRQTFKGRKGVPDLMVYVTGGLGLYATPGMWICIELKSTTGKQSKDQKEFQRVLEEKGGKYFIVRGIDDLIVAGL